MAKMIEIGPAEAGQQLGRFLERRLDLPRALVFRWLREGQVRVNGGRAKAARLLEAGDVLRLPPQAGLTEASALQPCRIAPGALGPDVKIIFQDEEILVLDKPYGLPMHGGTRHTDSLAARIKDACGKDFYVPAPAHRLDLHASGLILAGKTHAAQTRLHALFREAKYELEREYLCWARGNAGETFAEPLLCTDFIIEERDTKGRERMAVTTAVQDPENAPQNSLNNSPENSKEARALYHCLEVRRHPEFGQVSLIKARLLTGRKHQIRAQLAARRFPLLGDWRYGGSKKISMMLHASRLALPDHHPAVFTSNPPWQGFFAVNSPDGEPECAK